MNTLGTEEFKLQNLCPYPSICIFGKRASGKSLLVKSILDHYKNTRKVVVSPIEKFNPFYSRYFDDVEVHYEWSESLIKQLLVEQNSEEKELVIVFDDCLFSEESLDSNIFKELLLNGKAYKITLIMAMQSCFGFKSCCRNKINYVFSLKNSITREQNALWQYYFNTITTFDEFKIIFTELTEDYSSIVIDNIHKNDTIFHYKVKREEKQSDEACNE